MVYIYTFWAFQFCFFMLIYYFTTLFIVAIDLVVSLSAEDTFLFISLKSFIDIIVVSSIFCYVVRKLVRQNEDTVQLQLRQRLKVTKIGKHMLLKTS